VHQRDAGESTNGMRNPENSRAIRIRTLLRAHLPDSMSQFGGGIKFRDLQGLAKYPVDGSQLGEARVFLRSYRPAAHFTRRLVIPDVRLSDWKADAAAEHARLAETNRRPRFVRDIPFR